MQLPSRPLPQVAPQVSPWALVPLAFPFWALVALTNLPPSHHSMSRHAVDAYRPLPRGVRLHQPTRPPHGCEWLRSTGDANRCAPWMRRLDPERAYGDFPRRHFGRPLGRAQGPYPMLLAY